MRRSSRALLTAAYLAACGDKGGETMTDDETSAGTTGVTSQPTTGASTTGLDPCTPQPPSPLGPSVEIELVNMRADPVYIDGTYDCEPVMGYLIFPEGSEFALELDANCHFECPTVIAGGAWGLGSRSSAV